MTLKEQFLENAQQEVENNSIYVFGGQGQETRNLTVKQIGKMETNDTNVSRILRHIANIYPNIKKSKAFDCSGLITYHLMKLGLIKSDTTANGLYKMCVAVEPSDLRPGDLVFTVKNDKASHVAIFRGGVTPYNLIESVGRDDGVKNTKFNSTKFNKCGRLPFFV